MSEGSDEWRTFDAELSDKTITFDGSDDHVDIPSWSLEGAIGASEVAERAQQLRERVDPRARVLDPTLREIRQQAAQELQEKSIEVTTAGDVIYECTECGAPRPTRVDEGDIVTSDLSLRCWGVCESVEDHAITGRMDWDVAKVELVCPVCGYETLDWADPGGPDHHEDCPECLSEPSGECEWEDIRNASKPRTRLREAADEVIRINDDVEWGNALEPSVTIRGFNPFSRGLSQVSGLNAMNVEALGEAGYVYIGDLMAASQDDLEAVSGFGTALAARVKSDVGDWPFDGKRIGKLRVSDVWFEEGRSV